MDKSIHERAIESAQERIRITSEIRGNKRESQEREHKRNRQIQTQEYILDMLNTYAHNALRIERQAVETKELQLHRNELIEKTSELEIQRTELIVRISELERECGRLEMKYEAAIFDINALTRDGASVCLMCINESNPITLPPCTKCETGHWISFRWRGEK